MRIYHPSSTYPDEAYNSKKPLASHLMRKGDK